MKKLRKMNVQKNARKMVWLEILLAVAVLQFAGCTVGPNVPPSSSRDSSRLQRDGKLEDLPSPATRSCRAKWWEIFQDAQLNALEEQIDVSNQNLKAAFAQYQQARAVLRYYRADYYPTVTANPSAGRTRYSQQSPTPQRDLQRCHL